MPEPMDPLLQRLQGANAEFNRHFAGASLRPQPVHTLYWGAHLLRPDSWRRLGESARDAFARWADSPPQLARALGFPGADALPRDRQGVDAMSLRFADDPEALARELPDTWLAWAVHARVRGRLATAPIEDLRIDFEDGYGIRPDAEEDGDARAAANALASALADGSASACSGIRIKPLTDPCMRRSIATLERFVGTLVDRHGAVPAGFRITLPKVQHVTHVEVACELLARCERALGLPELSLPLEFMVEVTQVLFDRHGRFQLPACIRAGGERLIAVALGVYDFTASAGITAAWQAIDHPICDVARGFMTLACGGTAVQVCDGSTNVLPVEPDPGASSDDGQRRNREAIWRAWRLMHDHVRRSLVGGYVQGWDLHPAQVPVRWAANYRFFLESLPAASERLRSYLQRATAATDGAAVLDDAATGAALLGFLQRARACGAIDDAALTSAGLAPEEHGLRSFPELLARRRRARDERAPG
ncbi:MAG: phosphoenolpyruvate kinase [Deltaproteobacteria bacterium]|nr:phosphoenolpyruvate kinase [Deltaproteobacteria bacterium]